MADIIDRTPTPHISAKKGDFAKTVLMPGDPLRAKYIAETYLEDVKQVTAVRNMFGYTGKYRGKEISVMGAGMGMPSMGIYSYELFNYYDVDNIVRIGSAGSINKDVHLMDIVIAEGACTNSSWNEQYNLRGTFAPIADFGLLRRAVEQAEKQGLNVKVGNVLSEDAFYDDDPDYTGRWIKMGVIAVEMEAAALYMNAARAGKHAVAILTISDEILADKHMSSEDREKSFGDMMELAVSMLE